MREHVTFNFTSRIYNSPQNGLATNSIVGWLLVRALVSELKFLACSFAWVCICIGGVFVSEIWQVSTAKLLCTSSCDEEELPKPLSSILSLFVCTLYIHLSHIPLIFLTARLTSTTSTRSLTFFSPPASHLHIIAHHDIDDAP
jgi:hypothetical protein